MSRPKYYWYNHVKKMIMEKDRIAERETLQGRLFQIALEEAVTITLSKPNGSERMKAINAVLFEQSANYDDVAINLYYNWRTVQNWITEFIKLVGTKAGF